MIKVKLQDRLGNQLFQYVFAKYAANILNKKYLLYVRYKYGFRLAYFKLPFPYRILPFTGFILRIYNYCVLKIFFKNFENYVENEHNNSVTIKNSTNYVGYFQNSKYAEFLKNDLQKDLKIKSRYLNTFNKKYSEFIRSKSLLIHLRLTDYNNQTLTYNNHAFSWKLPLEWYRKLIELAHDNDDVVYIISDDMKAVKDFPLSFNGKAHYLEGSEIEHFLCIMHAKKIIISNSSFAWWGAFLNSNPNKQIYAPYNWVGYNAGIEFPKGIMTKEFNWIK